MSCIEITGPTQLKSYLFNDEHPVDEDKIVVPGASVSSSSNFMRLAHEI
uniref:Uncharacterized protein n=1 Tax=Syphacia muris TaxID=451379 RepID=A0A0N5AC74_9BILA